MKDKVRRNKTYNKLYENNGRNKKRKVKRIILNE